MTTVNVSQTTGGITQVAYTGAYQSGYPYELVTHGEPNANSIFFDTAFATNGPVKWRVDTDYDSGIVVVDHAALDAAEDELNDVSLHSTDVAEGSSTATYGYFVPESGATGTWQATITVGTVADVTPAPFTVSPLTSQALDQFVEFAPITVADIDAGQDIAVTVTGTDVEYAVDTGSGYGAFTATSTNVQLGHIVKPRIRTSASPLTEVTGSISIGSESSSLSATTMQIIPQTAPVIGSITKDANSASIPFSAVDNADSYEHSADGGAWTTVTSPISHTGLNAETPYSGLVRAVNAAGSGSAASYSFTTDAVPIEPQVPQGVITFSFPVTDQTSVQAHFQYSLSDQTGFEYSLDGGAAVGTGKPVSISGLSQSTTYGLRVRAINATGNGGWFFVSFRTKSEPAPPAEDNWPFSKGVRYKAITNWEWGKRHPTTNMRVRIYK